MSSFSPQPGVATSDIAILDLLRKGGDQTVSQLVTATGVTATAVRQRLNRLMGQRLVERVLARAGRGRPAHRYGLTERGRRQSGSNFADLAIALWQEIRAIKDPKVRGGLLERLSGRLASEYGGSLPGETLNQRLESLADLFSERSLQFTVDKSGGKPTLQVLSCPYPDLSEKDRSICALEGLLFSELAGERLKLTQCRLDGQGCCTFESN